MKKIANKTSENNSYLTKNVIVFGSHRNKLGTHLNVGTYLV